jgi:hypothetical protein
VVASREGIRVLRRRQRLGVLFLAGRVGPVFSIRALGCRNCIESLIWFRGSGVSVGFCGLLVPHGGGYVSLLLGMLDQFDRDQNRAIPGIE